jgi:phospholipid transport system substrate-binding protein
MKVSRVIHIAVLSTLLWINNGYALENDQAEAVETADSSEEAAVSTERSSAIESFVTKIGNEIINILVHRSQPLDSRKAAFRKVLDRDFDMSSIGKFVIARYWRTMSPEQQNEYVRLFISAVVENYASQFDNYNNEKLVVTGSRQTEDGGYIVISTITRPGKGQPLKVEWKLFKTPRGMKVLDIVVDGVSMSITLRSEYSAVFNERGGVDGLLDYLREKSSDKVNNS